MSRKFTNEFRNDAVMYYREHPELTQTQVPKKLGLSKPTEVTG